MSNDEDPTRREEPDGAARSAPPYRTAITDALGRPIPDDGQLRLWLYWDCVAHPAPEGWIHLVTAREARLLHDAGRVAELELDPQLEDQDASIARGESMLLDLLCQPIPEEGELRLWLDDLWVERRADPGWVHLRTAREVAFLLATGRVVELLLDHDLGDKPEWPHKFGKGTEVIDMLDEYHGVHRRPLWPRNGITLHTTNVNGRATMMRAIESVPRRHGVAVREGVTPGGKPHYDFPLEPTSDT